MIRGAEAEKALAGWIDGPTLVLGIGAVWCGDDAVGPLLCTQVPAPYLIDCGDAPERFLGQAGDPQVARVLLVDAMDFGGRPGEVAFCDGEDLTEGAGTTHTTGLAVLVRYLRTVHVKPVAVLGIQPAQTHFGAGMSPAVQETAVRLGTALARNVAAQWEAAWTRS